MAKTGAPREGSDDGALLALFRAIASRDDREVERRLDESRNLATRPIHIGATRDASKPWFLDAIHHYVYSGDTALHLAAAAHQRRLAESLVVRGADVRARNRRGAEPLHYAADGGPGANGWDAVAQRDTISYLIEAGADPNALDQSGVAPLHRAVRNRCSTAVSALIDNGADPLLRNTSGSTPLHLAVQNTGKSNSGSAGRRTNRAGSSSCSSGTARVRPMPTRTARPSRRPLAATGSAICWAPTEPPSPGDIGSCSVQRSDGVPWVL